MLVLAVVLSAIAVGLDNFAAAIGIGLAGVDARTRVRVAVVFGLFEAGMPLAGLLIGHGAASSLGRTTRYVGGAMLVAAGLWLVLAGWLSRRGRSKPAGPSKGRGRLVLTALALSIDNLVVGFGLGVTKIPLALALLVFAVVSVALSLAGLEVGRRLGARMQRRSDELAGVVLIAVGILVAANVF